MTYLSVVFVIEAEASYVTTLLTADRGQQPFHCVDLLRHLSSEDISVDQICCRLDSFYEVQAYISRRIRKLSKMDLLVLDGNEAN